MPAERSCHRSAGFCFLATADTTVLTLTRDAAALVAEAMSEVGDAFAIHGFDSSGRHDVAYHRFKDFDEPYGDAVRARLAGMTGQRSTRIGAAVRHAGHWLATRRAERRLLVLVTDGAPHDVDVHDRRYLVMDARRAVVEQARRGITSVCVSLDRRAEEPVRRMFGRHRVTLDHVRRLPEALPAIYLRLIGR